MATEDDLDELSRTEQLILLGVVELDEGGQTPVQAPEVREHCRERMAGVDDDAVIGDLTGSEVARALYTLEDRDVVTATDPARSSPVGKGRPGYEPNVDAEEVVDRVDETPVLVACVERLTDSV